MNVFSVQLERYYPTEDKVYGFWTPTDTYIKENCVGGTGAFIYLNGTPQETIEAYEKTAALSLFEAFNESGFNDGTWTLDPKYT